MPSPRVRQILGALLTEPLIVTLAALAFTLPLTMLYFGQLSPAVLLVNLLIVPVQPALLLLGGAATLTTAVLQPLAQILYWLDLIPLSWTIEVVRLFARLPAAEVFVSPNLIAAFFVVADRSRDAESRSAALVAQPAGLAAPPGGGRRGADFGRGHPGADRCAVRQPPGWTAARLVSGHGRRRCRADPDAARSAFSGRRRALPLAAADGARRPPPSPTRRSKSCS
ncbi:MAG: ComEC/Rec2 family competence protein [Anaerolineae bacterium]